MLEDNKNMATKTQIIYRLDNVNADEGVDLFEIAPILTSFGDLIKESSDVLGLDQKIQVKVRPFKEGSWITELIVHEEVVRNIFNYLKTPDGAAVGVILGLLGFNAKDGIKGVVGIVKFTKGKVSNFKKMSDDTVEYFNDDGASIRVSAAEHRLVQSPSVQVNIYNGVISPLEKFPETGSVSIKVDGDEAVTVSEEDKTSFDEYARTELLEEAEDSLATMSGALIKPKRGSYSGEQKAYSFYLGDTVLYPTTIDDEEFLAQLKSGDVRPFHEDVLKVNLEIRQKRDATNKIITHYTITEVLDYIEYQKPKQLRLGTEE